MNRRYDIDAIRVIAFALLILYHVGMFFIPWEYHIKNNVIYPELKFPMLFLNQWRLPLLFVVSGMGTCFALGKRTGRQYAGERFKRLFLPLLFGIFFIVPPQVYFERLTQGIDFGGYFHFWPVQFLKGTYPAGNFSWHHLWFILYLFIFSLVFLPFFLVIRRKANSWFNRRFAAWTSSLGGLLLIALPLLLWRMLLSGDYPLKNSLVNDWFGLTYYATFFVLGFMLTGSVFWESVKRHRYVFLSLGIVLFPLLMVFWFGGFQKTPVFDLINDATQTLNLWCWILAIFGFSAVYLAKPSRALAYANEAVYPFYILHQTVIVTLGYYLRDWEVGFFLKFTVMVVLTFGICWLIYEFGIRRWRFIRPLFGVKNRPVVKPEPGTPI